MITIIDNFFRDPYKIRKVALESNFKSDLRYPGYRCDLNSIISPQVSLSTVEYQLEKRIKDILNKDIKIFYAAFQFTDKSWITGISHFDYNKSGFTGISITFLTLDPPSNSGTEIYDHVNNYRSSDRKLLSKNFEFKKSFYSSNRNFSRRFLFKRKLKAYNSHFKDPCIVNNKFNRTVVFDSKRIHRAQDLFGTNLVDSRLTLVSFFS